MRLGAQPRLLVLEARKGALASEIQSLEVAVLALQQSGRPGVQLLDQLHHLQAELSEVTQEIDALRRIISEG